MPKYFFLCIGLFLLVGCGTEIRSEQSLGLPSTTLSSLESISINTTTITHPSEAAPAQTNSDVTTSATDTPTHQKLPSVAAHANTAQLPIIDTTTSTPKLPPTEQISPLTVNDARKENGTSDDQKKNVQESTSAHKMEEMDTQITAKQPQKIGAQTSESKISGTTAVAPKSDLAIQPLASEETYQYVSSIITRLAAEYAIPDWFLMAIVHRESSFQPAHINTGNDAVGTDNWNHRRMDGCTITDDGYPHGVGLTQLTGWMYVGRPYPLCLSEPDNTHPDYYHSMRQQDFGSWITMSAVSPLSDPLDPEQNLRRFITGYAKPAYILFAKQYPNENSDTRWRRVAFHWNKGLYRTYDPNNQDYLREYDLYVAQYKK